MDYLLYFPELKTLPLAPPLTLNCSVLSAALKIELDRFGATEEFDTYCFISFEVSSISAAPEALVPN